MEDLVIFALTAKLPKDVLSLIDFPKKKIAPTGKKSLTNFANKLQEFKFIVGLGDYSGKDQNNLRLETECHREDQTFHINNLLKPITGVIYSEDIGNSYCNLISFMITKNYPNTSYSFIHIPKKMDAKFAAKKINELIEDYFKSPESLQ